MHVNIKRERSASPVSMQEIKKERRSASPAETVINEEIDHVRVLNQEPTLRSQTPLRIKTEHTSRSSSPLQKNNLSPTFPAKRELMSICPTPPLIKKERFSRSPQPPNGRPSLSPTPTVIKEERMSLSPAPTLIKEVLRSRSSSRESFQSMDINDILPKTDPILSSEEIINQNDADDISKVHKRKHKDVKHHKSKRSHKKSHRRRSHDSVSIELSKSKCSP